MTVHVTERLPGSPGAVIHWAQAVRLRVCYGGALELVDAGGNNIGAYAPGTWAEAHVDEKGPTA